MAHRRVAEVVAPGDRVIDATAGNGHDTVILAERVGATGIVVAFDVQTEALASTGRRLEAAGYLDRVKLVQASHVEISRHAECSSVAAIMFNLGYFPGGDHEVITETAETLKALDAALVALKRGGVLTVVCYPGHDGGDEESAAVTEWSRRLDRVIFPSEIHRRMDTQKPAPFLVLVRRS